MSDTNHSTHRAQAARTADWDHSSHESFYEHYATGSLSPQALQRLRSIRDNILQTLRRDGSSAERLDVADIGCAAGTQSMLWAELGHCVHGLDVNEPLLRLARERSASAGYSIDFQVGSATELPWEDESMDVVLALELLEHVEEWKTCLKEFVRILRPRGVLFLATSNKLCPLQQEFRLPLYSWYPGAVKRHFEALAKTSRPELANYAKYPAVNWFSFYALRDSLASGGFRCLDRFDLLEMKHKGGAAKLAVGLIRALPPLRWLGHVCTPWTILLAVKS